MPGSRSWDLSDFRLQRLNPLPGLQEGEEEGVASQISSSAAAPTEGGGGEGQTEGRSRALAQKRELFGNRVKGSPLSLGLQTARLVRRREPGTWGARVGTHMCTHGSSGPTGVPLREVAPALVSVTPHTGPGTQESKNNVD